MQPNSQHSLHITKVQPVNSVRQTIAVYCENYEKELNAISLSLQFIGYTVFAVRRKIRPAQGLVTDHFNIVVS